MRQSVIYEIKIEYIGSISELRKRENFVVYFSNLKRAVESVQSNLALNGWEQKNVNYSAVYRSMKQKGKFSAEFSEQKVKFFKVHICTKILNPILNTLGIDEHPSLKVNNR